MDVRVLWTNDAVRGIDLAGSAAAVVDCLRATTSVVAALSAGANQVVPVAEVAEARAFAEGWLRAGEQRTVPIPGFDLGNSPDGFTAAAVAGRDIVLVTTNGSKALRWTADAGAAPIAAFALVNVAATARRLASASRLCIVCAGTRGAFALDDACCAGALIDRLQGLGAPLDLDDAAQAALRLYRGGGADLVAASEAAANLRAHSYEGDLAHCMREDVSDVVPLWNGEGLRAG